MITRIGKIGRLPKAVRDKLGAKIWNNVPGTEIAAWLNSLPEVQEILGKQFGNRPITEQNISNWKQNGHAEWERQLQRRELVMNLGADAEELEAETGGREISDRFASLVTVEMVHMAQVMLEEETDVEKRWARLREVNKELSRLRRDDHQAVRAVVERTGWQKQQEQARKDEEPERAMRKTLCAGYLAGLEIPDMVEKFGDNVHGRKAAALVLEVQHDLPPGMLNPSPEDIKRWEEEKEAAENRDSQAKSHPVPPSAPMPGTGAEAKKSSNDKQPSAATENPDSKPREGQTTGQPDPAESGKTTTNPT